MSANAGSVRGTIEGDASGFVKAAGSAADSVEHFAKRAKRMATDFAVVGAGITASIIGIVSKVQSLDPVAHATFQNFTNASETLGIQIARVAAPALDALARALREVANYMAGLSPATKQHIADMIVLAAQVGAAALVFGRVMELTKGLAMAFQATTAIVGGAITVFTGLWAALVGVGEALVAMATFLSTAWITPILLGAAAIAAIIAIVILLRKAWEENWGGMRDFLQGFIKGIASDWAAVVNFLSGLWQGMVDDLASKVKIMIALFFQLQDAMPGKKNPMAGLQQGVMMQAVDTTAGLAKHPIDTGSVLLEQAGKKIAGAAGDIVSDFKKLLKQLLDSMGLSSKPGATATAPINPDVLQMMRAGAAEQRSNALADSQRGIDMARRTRDFNNVGSSDRSITSQKIDGFADFNDALKREASALRQQEQLISSAKMMELRATQLAASGDNSGAQAALDSAENLRLLAQQAGVTAQSAEDAANAFMQLKEAPSQIIEALKMGADMMTKNLGQLGTVINDVAKGWQQGGIWGALIAFVMDLLSMMDGWKDIQAIANGQLKMALKDMASGLGGILGALKPVMGAVGIIANAVHGILNPILGLIGKLLAGLAPVLAMIGYLLSSLGPIIDVICNLIGSILTPILQLLGPILTVVAETFLFMKLTIEYTILALYVMIDAIEKFGGGAGDQGDIDKAKKDVLDTQQQMVDLANKGLDGMANASADAAEQLGKTADAAASVTQQLLNVPEGFKVALAAFTATQPIGGGGGGGGRGPTLDTAARNNFIRSGSTLQSGYPRRKP